MKSIFTCIAALGLILFRLPATAVAQEAPPVSPTVLDMRLSVDSLAAERSGGVLSVVVRSDWTKADVLLGARRGVPTETVRLTKNDRARYPVVNYAIQTIAANACVQRVPNTETGRCFPRRLNGTPVTRYPGIITDEPLQHPDPFVPRPGRQTP